MLTTDGSPADQREAHQRHNAQTCGFGDDREDDGIVGVGDEIVLGEGGEEDVGKDAGVGGVGDEVDGFAGEGSEVIAEEDVEGSGEYGGGGCDLGVLGFGERGRRGTWRGWRWLFH